jgi:hypothetical protein
MSSQTTLEPYVSRSLTFEPHQLVVRVAGRSLHRKADGVANQFKKSQAGDKRLEIASLIGV